MDYTRDTLFVQLRVLVDRSEPGKAVLDQQSFDDAKAAVLDRLRKDGIDPDSVTQVFIYRPGTHGDGPSQPDTLTDCRTIRGSRSPRRV